MYSPTSRLLTVLELLQSYPVTSVWGGAQQLFSPMLGTLEETDAGILLRRSASEFEWISHILLRADFPVIVRQPAELRQIIRDMSARALQILSDEA